MAANERRNTCCNHPNTPECPGGRCVCYLAQRSEEEEKRFQQIVHDMLNPGEGKQQTCDFSGFCFLRDAWFEGITFEEDARFGEASFSGKAMFGSASFRGEALFGGASFAGTARFLDNAFEGNAIFDGASFAEMASFEGSSFSNDASFVGAVFRAHVWFEGASFGGDAVFNGTSFHRTAEFLAASFGSLASFTGASFGGNAVFDATSFNGEAVFTRARFRENAGFMYAGFGRNVSFDGASFGGGIHFTGSTLASDCVVRTDAVSAGLGRAEELYRLARRTHDEIGNYEKAGGYHYGERVHSWFARSGISPEYLAEWDRFLAFRSRGRSDERRERRKRWRRRLRRHYLRPGSLWRAVHAFFRYGLKARNKKEFLFGNLVFGYGERPARPVKAAAAVIVLWGVLYLIFGIQKVQVSAGSEGTVGLLGGISGDWIPSPVLSVGRCLYFSAMTFATLGYGDYSPAGPISAVLACVEGLIGLALFATFAVCLAKRYARG